MACFPGFNGASSDSGGPGSISQLHILDEVMTRLEFEVPSEGVKPFPANHFDLMGGVGFGGLVALLLGRLRMTTGQAEEELAIIGADIFPNAGGMATREVSTERLRNAIEGMLKRHGHSAEMKLLDTSDNRCKV